jgi:MscS family membrane protein
MLSLLGFLIPIPPELGFLHYPAVQFGLNAATWLLIALVVNFVILRALRFITRQMPGDLEDILLAIVRGPLVLLIVIFGTVNSLELLPLSAALQQAIRQVTYSIVVITVAGILGRMIRDVLVFYGDKWARKSESRVDDILIPVINLFGPIILVLGAALIILPMWGINVTSVLVGAGVIGIVLGLALQETLSNVFSGLSLLIEAPFRTGDLISIPDGRLCEVQRIGLRSTQLYSIPEHAIVYVPNRTLAGATLTNVTRPTVDQKFSLTVNVGTRTSLVRTEERLRRIAAAHPAVLVIDMDEKISCLQLQIANMRERAAIFDENDPTRALLFLEAERNERVIPRLELEGRLNCQLDNLQETLRAMIRGITAREGKGLNEGERQEIYCNFIAPIENEVGAVTDLAKAWTEAEDPWLNHTDYWDLRQLWENRNELLRGQWEKVKKAIYHPDESMETRLDDVAGNLIDWIQREYKVVPSYWKTPCTRLKSLDGGRAVIELAFYVDNIRLEHYERANRVRTEIGHQIRDALGEFM